MRTFLLLILGFAAVSAVPKYAQRIVGGSVTTIEHYPEIVALLYSWTNSDHRQACAGTILNNRSILTAAHCTYGDAVFRWKVRYKSSLANSDGIVTNTQTIINHPQYNRLNYDNDLSIIRTASIIHLSNNVKASRIAGPNYNLGDNEVVFAAGWGTTSQGGAPSEQLRHVQMWTVNQNICRQRYAAVGNTITDNMLCSGWLDVGGRDQCQGDSGGPLFHNGVVVGICSWGRGCALAHFPGVNARVSRFTYWITQHA